jgi:hypothetical protein
MELLVDVGGALTNFVDREPETFKLATIRRGQTAIASPVRDNGREVVEIAQRALKVHQAVQDVPGLFIRLCKLALNRAAAALSSAACLRMDRTAPGVDLVTTLRMYSAPLSRMLGGPMASGRPPARFASAGPCASRRRLMKLRASVVAPWRAFARPPRIHGQSRRPCKASTSESAAAIWSSIRSISVTVERRRFSLDATADIM